MKIITVPLNQSVVSAPPAPLAALDVEHVELADQIAEYERAVCQI
jgi:hypothetical protein